MDESNSNNFLSSNDKESWENKDIIIPQNETNEELKIDNIQNTVEETSEVNSHIKNEQNSEINSMESSRKEFELAPELLQIKELIIALLSQFESKIKYDKHKEDIIDKLHNENQNFKNDIYKKLLLPLVNEIIILIDDYATLFKKHCENNINEIDVSKLLKQFGSISEDLENLLYKNGIDVLNVEGKQLDPSKQKVIKIILTDDPNKDKIVIEKLKKGFVWDGKIIRMEYVSCYKFEKTTI
jgi:molecular chaperone GrpE